MNPSNVYSYYGWNAYLNQQKLARRLQERISDFVLEIEIKPLRVDVCILKPNVAHLLFSEIESEFYEYYGYPKHDEEGDFFLYKHPTEQDLKLYISAS